MRSAVTTLETGSAWRKRTGTQRAVDALVNRWLKLKGPRGSYTVLRNQKVKMRDGVDLLVDVYAPLGASKGTILSRSPYGWNLGYSAPTAGVFATRGYHVVLARCRGTYGSGGDLDPFRTETEDGLDTVAWLREQRWFTGKFATYGASYTGFTQWALLADQPEEMVTAVIGTGPHNVHRSIHEGGALAMRTWLNWSEMNSRPETTFLRSLREGKRVAPLIADAMNELSLANAADTLMPGRGAWYREWITRRKKDDSYWAPMEMDSALDTLTIPILLQAGWNDLFMDQMFEQYDRLSQRGTPVAFTVGPWTHSEYVLKGGPRNIREALDWFDQQFTGRTSSPRKSTAQVHVAGSAQQWLELESWPPSSSPRRFTPSADGNLRERALGSGRGMFTYDPENPTPSIGGPLLQDGGYVDDTALAARPDVLSFTSTPLSGPLQMVGVPTLELDHSTDNPHADLWVRISDVAPDGKSTSVTERFVRLNPESATGTLVLRLWDTAYEFGTGHRIRLLIAGGSHPNHERNLGTSEDPARSTTLKKSHRTLELANTALLLPELLNTTNG